MKKAEKIILEFQKKDELNKNIFIFYFDKKVDFLPGQYIRLNLPIPNPDEKGTSRYFTISSSPLDKFIAITTRIGKSSFKKYLKNLKSGDNVNAFGPMGYFNFDPKNREEQIFLSGGMGITPFHSIIKFIDQEKINTKIKLIASFSKKNDVIFYDELKEIESRNENLKIIFNVTKEKIKNFENERISEELIQGYSKNYKKAKYYIVGSEDFEYGVYEIIKSIGIKEEKIFKENFPGY